MAKLPAGQKRRQKELKRRKKKQHQEKKQQVPTSMTFMDLPPALPRLSERLVEFAGRLLDESQTGRNYIENVITMVVGCWNMGAVTAEMAQVMRRAFSESFSEALPEVFQAMELHFDSLITARRYLYADDPRYIISHTVNWTGTNDYYLRIKCINLPDEERFSGRVEGAEARLLSEAREKMKGFRAPPLTGEETRLKQLIDRGFDLLNNNTTQTGEDAPEVAACETWLEAWDIIKKRYQDKPSLDTIGSRIEPTLVSWYSEMDMHLLNAALAKPALVEKGITFFREFLALFPESHEGTTKAYREAMAMLQFRNRAYDEGDATFNALVKDYPDSAWSYIHWGDAYNPTFPRAAFGDAPVDSERARNLYQIPIDQNLEDAEHAQKRIDALLAIERNENDVKSAET
ncbi:hypothetical protein [Endozoicomonas atrinae]|uniref:hypothetical protein n=1 Tax=Endozoicomonas atrinae TaxID=1333660 RepID=UPI003B006F65